MFMKVFILKVFAVVLLSTFFTGTVLAQDMEKAGKLYNEKKYSEAYLEFEEVYKKAPKNMDALNGMAWCNFQMGLIFKAERMFKDILRKSPSHAGAKQGLATVTAKIYGKINKAWSQYNASDFKNAINSFNLILEDKERLLPEKELWRVYLGLGYSYYGKKRYTEAKRSFRDSLKKKENYNAYKGIGLTEFQTGNYEAAVKSFNSSLKLNPSRYDVSSLLAWSYLRSGKTEKAIEGFRRQIAINPNIADTHYGLALSLNKKGDRKEAMKEFYTVVFLLPGYLINDEFLQVLEEVEEYKPIYRDLGWALYHAGLFIESLKVFELGFKNKPKNADLLRGAGYSSLKIKEYNKAIKYSSKSLSMSPALPPVFENAFAPGTGLLMKFYSDAQTTLAWAYFYKKDYVRAEKEFKKALETYPDWPDANSGLGWVLYSLKKYDNAEEQFNKTIKLDPTYHDAYSGLTAVRNAKLSKPH